MEADFESIVREWFSFAKQRKDRGKKAKEKERENKAEKVKKA